MPVFFYITEKSDIQCGHGGKMNLSGLGDPNFIVDGAGVITQSKLAQGRFEGCPQSPPMSKPCLTILPLTPDLVSKSKHDNQFFVTSAIYGKAKTDGVPPATVMGDAKQEFCGEDLPTPEQVMHATTQEEKEEKEENKAIVEEGEMPFSE